MKKKILVLLPKKKKDLSLLSDTPCKADVANGAASVQNECHREEMGSLMGKTVWPYSSALGTQRIFCVKPLDKSYSQHISEGPITQQADDTVPAPAAFLWPALTCKSGGSLVSHGPKKQRTSPNTSNSPDLGSQIPWGKKLPSTALRC